MNLILADIKIEVSARQQPKAAEVLPDDLVWGRISWRLCSGYYDGVFPSQMKGFRVQTGDPTNTGKGGSSIWAPSCGRNQIDIGHNSEELYQWQIKELTPTDRNSSSYTQKQSHLDSKYTVFGKYVLTVTIFIDALESVSVDSTHRPNQDVRIISVTVHANPIAEN
ncbi:hypothetical protein BASA83_011215 [Batrachochytrium salamandrivorans]|nr:hypothetical protein BASA83_011215 [Batrachochytrium salamandrivorans]